MTVSTPTADYPRRRGLDLIFPVGTFRTVLPGPELRRACAQGNVLHYHALVIYECQPALADYAKALYALRCEAQDQGQPGLASMVKSLLVSLPGKFGQRSRYWELAPELWSEAPYCEWWVENHDGTPTRIRSVAWQCWRERVEEFAPDAVPALAAWITSEARLRLLAAMETAGRAHVYYVDTDSLMVDEHGMEALRAGGRLVGDALGQLYLRSGPSLVEIYGIKHYTENGVLTCAGLPKGEHVDAGDGHHYWYCESPSQSVHRGRSPGARQTLSTYARSQPYRHGIVFDDGSVHPHYLEA